MAIVNTPPDSAELLNASIPQPFDSYASRRRVRITREGWAAIGLTGWVLASAVISHASLTLLVFCMLLVALAVGGIQTIRNLRHLKITRRLPDQAVAGRPIHLEIDLHNRRFLGTAQGLVISSPVQPAAQQSQPSVFLAAVPPRGHITERIETVLPNRGLYRFDKLEITSRFPFGFMERTVLMGEPQQLLVYPKLGKLSRRYFEFERENHPHQEGRRPGPASTESDYRGLREFRDGDNPRWIHWPTSARRGRVMVREFEARHNRDVAILLDPWIPANATPRDRNLLEIAISFAATACAKLCESHSLHLVLGIASNPPLVRHGQTSSQLLRELLEQLALVQGTSETPWDELFGELPPSWTNQMRITAVGPRVLDLASRGGDVSMRRRWKNLARRLIEVNVASDTLHQYFELH